MNHLRQFPSAPSSSHRPATAGFPHSHTGYTAALRQHVKNLLDPPCCKDCFRRLRSSTEKNRGRCDDQDRCYKDWAYTRIW